MLAMDVQTTRSSRQGALSLTTIASRLAPTVGSRTDLQSGRLSGRLAFAFLAFDFLAPSRGRVEVLRSGQTGMDAGLAAPGHGWPMAAGPRSRTGARACRALARHRTPGARALGYLGLFQVTRCKSETASGRYRSNGYSPKPNMHRVSIGLAEALIQPPALPACGA